MHGGCGISFACFFLWRELVCFSCRRESQKVNESTARFWEKATPIRKMMDFVDLGFGRASCEASKTQEKTLQDEVVDKNPLSAFAQSSVFIRS